MLLPISDAKPLEQHEDLTPLSQGEMEGLMNTMEEVQLCHFQWSNNEEYVVSAQGARTTILKIRGDM